MARQLALVPALLLISLTAVQADETPGELVKRGMTNARQGNFDEAIVDFNAALDLDAEFHDAYVGRGGAKFRKGDHVGAIKDLDMALLLEPGDASVYYMRGKIKDDFGDLKGSLSDLGDALLLQPSGFLYMEIAKLKHRHHDLEGAVASYDKALETLKGLDRADAFIFRGVTKADAGDLKGALADMDQAVITSPAGSAVHIMRGIIKALKGDREGALADFAKSTEIGKNKVSRLWLGAMGGDAKALEPLAKEKDGPAPVARYLLGQQDLATTVADAAKSEHEQVRAGQACEAHCYIGINAEREDKLELAKEHYKKSLATGVTGFLEYDWCRLRLRQLGEKTN
jgi:tetratricopeptide (TPR) repeat protein